MHTYLLVSKITVLQLYTGTYKYVLVIPTVSTRQYLVSICQYRISGKSDFSVDK